MCRHIDRPRDIDVSEGPPTKLAEHKTSFSEEDSL